MVRGPAEIPEDKVKRLLDQLEASLDRFLKAHDQGDEELIYELPQKFRRIIAACEYDSDDLVSDLVNGLLNQYLNAGWYDIKVDDPGGCCSLVFVRNAPEPWQPFPHYSGPGYDGPA